MKVLKIILLWYAMAQWLFTRFETDNKKQSVEDFLSVTQSCSRRGAATRVGHCIPLCYSPACSWTAYSSMAFFPKGIRHRYECWTPFNLLFPSLCFYFNYLSILVLKKPFICYIYLNVYLIYWLFLTFYARYPSILFFKKFCICFDVKLGIEMWQWINNRIQICE